MKHPGKELNFLNHMRRKQWSDDDLSSDEEEKEKVQEEVAEAQQEQPPEPPPQPTRTVFQPMMRGKGAALVAMKRPRTYQDSDDDDDEPQAKRKSAARADEDEEDDEMDEDDEGSDEQDSEEDEEEDSDDEPKRGRARKKPAPRRAAARRSTARAPAAKKTPAAEKKEEAPKKRAATAKRQVQQEEEEEEEEDDSNDPMAEYYKDEKDRKWLKSLPEVERERILAERHEERVAAEQKKKIEELLEKQKQDQQKKAKKGGRQAKPAAARGRGRKKAQDEKVLLSEKESSEEEEGELEMDDAAIEEAAKRAAAASAEERLDFVDEESEDEAERAKKDAAAAAAGEKDRGSSKKDAVVASSVVPPAAGEKVPVSLEKRDEGRVVGAIDEEGNEGEGDAKRTTRRMTRARARQEEEDVQVEEDDVMDVDDDEYKANKEAKKPHVQEAYDPNAPYAPYDLMRKLQIKRHYLEKWLVEPYFRDAVRGGFVRVNIDVVGGVQVNNYHYAEVTDVITGRMYNFGPLKCDLYLKVMYGGEVLGGASGLPIRIVSNQAVTEDEYESWVAKCKDDRVRLLTEDNVQARLMKRVEVMKAHRYTEAEITKQMELRKKYRAGASKKELSQQLGKKKANLQRELDIHESTILRLTRALDREEKESNKEELQRQIVEARREMDETKRNLDNVVRMLEQQAQKAQESNKDWSALAEKGKLERQRILEEISSAAATVGNSNSQEADPFQRRRTAPKVLWSVGASKIKKDEAANGSAAGSAPSTPPKHPKGSGPTALGNKPRAGTPISRPFKKAGLFTVPASATIDDADEVDPTFDPLAMLDDPVLNKYMPKPTGKRSKAHAMKPKRRLGLHYKEYLRRADEGGLE